MFSIEKLEGIDYTCQLMVSFLRLVFFIALMMMGGTTALAIYILLMFGIALVLPLIVSYH